MSSDSEASTNDEKLATLLPKNRLIYIKHNFKRDGSRFLNAEWQGVWHLACVCSPWNEESGKFEVMWSRNGKYEKRTMKYKPNTIQPFNPHPKTILLIEDDDKSHDKTSNIHYAIFHSFARGQDKINIRWESTREVQEIDLSRVCLDIGGNKNSRRKAANFYSVESVKLESGGRGTSSRGSAVKRGRKKGTTIELLDTSSDEEDLMNNAPVAKIVTPEKLFMLDDCSDDGGSDVSNGNLSVLGDFSDDGELEVSRKRGSSSYSNSSSRGNSEHGDGDLSLIGGKIDDEFSAVDNDESSENGGLIITRPLSCRGSLRKSRARYNEQSEDGSLSSQNYMHGRRLDLNSISSGTESNNVDAPAAKRSMIVRENDESVRKRRRTSEVVLSGFSISDDNGDYADYLATMAHSLKSYKDAPIEYEDVLTELHTTIQEKLYNVKDKTTLKVNPQTLHQSSENPATKKDGNMTIIHEFATKFGLSSSQIDDLFADLGDPDEYGYFSINDSVPLVLRMSNGTNDTSWSAAAKKSNGQMRNLTDHVGRRVKTVLEDGQEYSGTITNVTFRVKYDDGDTETQTEKEVWENLIDHDTYFSEQDTSGNMLELFSGCSLLSTMCKRKGMNAISVDNDPESNASIKADFMSEHVQNILQHCVQDYIHASPVCSTYSRLAGNRHRDKNNYNKSVRSHEADKVLMKLYLNLQHQLRMNPDCIITIENPRGWMMKGNIMKMLFEDLGFKAYQIYYCQFGRDEMKPTFIITNDEKLGKILVGKGGKCRCSGNHKDGVRESSFDTNFAALPFELCQLLSSYVHSKVTQLKFDKLIQDKCSPAESMSSDDE